MFMWTKVFPSNACRKHETRLRGPLSPDRSRSHRFLTKSFERRDDLRIRPRSVIRGDVLVEPGGAAQHLG